MPSDKARLYVALYVRGGAAKMPGKEDKLYTLGGVSKPKLTYVYQIPLGTLGCAQEREQRFNRHAISCQKCTRSKHMGLRRKTDVNNGHEYDARPFHDRQDQ